MLGNRLSLHRIRFDATAFAPFDLGALRRLQAALAELPADWLVLLNQRASPLEGPPWVRFMALHPRQGIALIDLAPANPDVAIAPLSEFLARSEAFLEGTPPIAAVALTDDDIDAIGKRLTAAFSSMPPCGITKANWTEAVAELLMSTPGLLLARLGCERDVLSADKHSSRGEEEAPEGMLGAIPDVASEAGHDRLASPPRSIAPEQPSPSEGQRNTLLKVENLPSPAAPPPDFENTRYLWAAPTVIAASLVIGAAALVYADRPKPFVPAIAEVEKTAPRANERAEASEVSAAIGADQALASPAAHTMPRRHIVASVVPIWEKRAPTSRVAKAPIKARSTAVASAVPIWEERAPTSFVASAPTEARPTARERWLAQIDGQLDGRRRRF